MKVASIQSHIKTLETQLEVLKAKAKDIQDEAKEGYSFASLYGLIQGQSKSTIDEIKKIS